MWSLVIALVLPTVQNPQISNLTINKTTTSSYNQQMFGLWLIIRMVALPSITEGRCFLLSWSVIFVLTGSTASICFSTTPTKTKQCTKGAGSHDTLWHPILHTWHCRSWILFSTLCYTQSQQLDVDNTWDRNHQQLHHHNYPKFFFSFIWPNIKYYNLIWWNISILTHTSKLFHSVLHITCT